MEVVQFTNIQAEFMERIRHAVYCNVATVDLKNRPRLRIMHVIWEGSTGWVISWPKSHKAKHLANNAYVSLAYSGNPHKPVYIECTASWESNPAEQQRIWELHKETPAPLGFDPTPYYGTIENEYFGLLCFIPWRIEIAELGKESIIWRR